MTDIPEKDYQKLCPGDKRNITENQQFTAF